MKEVVNSISVIICAYTDERWNELVAAVESIRQQTMPPRETIIIIDHNPGLFSRVQEHLSDVVAIENCGHKGASGARNCGVAVAQGTIVAFLDDDAIAQSDWLENMVICYNSPDIVGVGGKIEPLWRGGCPEWFPAEFNWVIGCTYLGMPTTIMPVRNMIGANMSIRKQALTTVNGFRETFGNNKGADVAPTGPKWLHHYAGDEETELCIRVSQMLQGSIWLYTNTAIVQHQVSAQRARLKYFLWRCYDEGLGKALLVKIHGTQTSLSAEREYAFRTLPRGIVHGFTEALLYCKVAGLTRAGAIILGGTVTLAGYFVGSIFSQLDALRDTNSDTIYHNHHKPIPPSTDVKNVGPLWESR